MLIFLRWRSLGPAVLLFLLLVFRILHFRILRDGRQHSPALRVFLADALSNQPAEVGRAAVRHNLLFGILGHPLDVLEVLPDPPVVPVRVDGELPGEGLGARFVDVVHGEVFAEDAYLHVPDIVEVDILSVIGLARGCLVGHSGWIGVEFSDLVLHIFTQPPQGVEIDYVAHPWQVLELIVHLLGFLHALGGVGKSLLMRPSILHGELILLALLVHHHFPPSKYGDERDLEGEALVDDGVALKRVLQL